MTATKTAQAIAGAEAHLAEVEARIAAGGDVSALDLADAKHAVELARIRHGHVERQEAEEADRARLARIQAIASHVKQLGDPSDVDAATATFKGACLAYFAAIERHNARITAAADELNSLGPLPDGIALQFGGFGVTGVADAHPVTPQTLALTTLRDAFMDAFPGRGHSLY